MKQTVARIIVSFISLFCLIGASNAQTQYVRYEHNGGISWGELSGTTIHQLSNAPYQDGSRTGQTAERGSVMLKAPVEPQLVVMTALNFRSHIRGEPAAYPGLFIVPAGSIIGPEEDIIRPVDSTNLHYEAELVVVIGKRAEVRYHGDYPPNGAR